MCMGFRQVFTRGRPSLIGMVHIRPLPGTPLNSMTVTAIIDKACEEAHVLRKHGLDGLILENMHDLPYNLSSNIGPEITASMTAVCSKVKEECSDMAVGVQILAGANQHAMAVAQAAGLQFIRAEGFVFAHVADEGLMQSCAGDLLRYRRMIGAQDVGIFTDIKKKHSSHAITSDISLAETAHAAEFFLSDGLIITGRTTGDAAASADVKETKSASSLPVLVGSGVTAGNMEEYADANGFIIGSYFKYAGHWRNELDIERIQMFMETYRKRWC